MTRITAARVIAGVGNARLSLHNGGGYWYFVYDDGGDVYETRSVMVQRLGDMSLDAWIAEGRALCQIAESRA